MVGKELRVRDDALVETDDPRPVRKMFLFWCPIRAPTRRCGIKNGVDKQTIGLLFRLQQGYQFRDRRQPPIVADLIHSSCT
jgi:hypothetical protein